MYAFTDLKIVSLALTTAIVVFILALGFREFQSDWSESRSNRFTAPTIEDHHPQQPSV
jgi:hypothetical protein